VKLAHAGPREAAVYLPETIRPALGSVVRATLYSETSSVPARLRQLSDAADLLTRTFEARYVLGGAAAKAPLGATVTIQIPESAGSDSMQVPIASITDRGRGPGVWVVNKNTSTVSFRLVKVLRTDNEDATVANGLQPGEEIVALGAHLLSDGQRVIVADAKAAIQWAISKFKNPIWRKNGTPSKASTFPPSRYGNVPSLSSFLLPWSLLEHLPTSSWAAARTHPSRSRYLQSRRHGQGQPRRQCKTW